MSQGIKITALNNLTQTASGDIMYVVDSTDTVSKKVELQNLLYDNMITPAKLSTGAPTWTANGQMIFDGAIYTDQIIGREDFDGLILRADPESPDSDPNEGGPMIQMFSADRKDGNGDPQNPNQIYYRANFHIFQNKAGSLVAQIPSTATPTLSTHLVRKDYVDEFSTKAFCVFNGDLTGTNPPTTGKNVTSVTRVEAGVWIVNLAITAPSDTFCVHASATSYSSTTTNYATGAYSLTNTTIRVERERSSNGDGSDTSKISVMAIW